MNLNDPTFTDEAKALAYFETITWPNGPVCPHCGETERVYRLEGKSHRPGLIHCNGCDGSFTVRTGGVMESSHVPLTKWALAFYLFASSKKGISAHQLMRTLGLGSYRTAWFMAHRIREAMGPAKGDGPVGGGGKIVEVDETELAPSRKTRPKTPRKRSNNKGFVALVERDGKVRSAVIDGRDMRDVRSIVRTHLDPDSILHTDGAQFYKGMMPLGKHESVDHNKMYARDSNNGRVHTNTAEGYFSLFKRGLVGTYQHISPAHLPRYLNEFDFRMSNRVKLGVDDTERTSRAIKGAKGKRLTYHQPNAA
jgi:transposase-like protein